ncbi:hypothetical protein F2P81_004822 [Scophthalmus maximus]|uniref:Nuclear envelope phosphatase-regulatory subunit 1 n=1 Tax=Scophthalmus maximus TaxID=52904 RepID=A0A6A4TE71_SCOMX|nr:hypothetical protein F2P81_004822 [Scophthalmus maximus]
MNSLEQAEDLKAFERRLTEYVSCLQPATGRWRMILIVVSVCTATGAWNWLIDPDTQKTLYLAFAESLRSLSDLRPLGAHVSAIVTGQGRKERMEPFNSVAVAMSSFEAADPLTQPLIYFIQSV